MHDSEQEHSGITGCRVTYESTIFYNEANKFSIIVVKTNDPRIPLQACSDRYYGDRMLRFTAVGYELPRTKAVELELDGEWVESKYGYQLQVEQWQEIVPQTADGLLAYLGSGLIKGIGPKTAEDIVATFGPDTLNILDNEPEKLLQIRGITEGKLKDIEESYAESRVLRNLMSLLGPFKITPATALKIYQHFGPACAERLQRQGCTLQGVPGFYTDNAGRWTINFGSRTAGILLPAVGMDGLICGMQIRLDTPLRRRDDPPGKSGAKYIWLSSIGKPHGVTSGSPLHFVGEPFAKTVYVTEGLLKADIAHCLTGRSFVAVAGVNSLNGLESALRCMAQNGTKLVVEAYDMDKSENEYVADAAEKVQQIAHTAGLQSTSLVWNTAYKGIDDWQLALRQEETKEKAA